MWRSSRAHWLIFKAILLEKINVQENSLQKKILYFTLWHEVEPRIKHTYKSVRC